MANHSKAKTPSNPPTYADSRGLAKPPHRSGGDLNAFRPNLLALPKDPFASRPWVVDFDALPLPNEGTTRVKQTVLVIGTPPQHDLNALVHSSLLQDSLVLIATHDVKPFASLVLLSPSSTASKRDGPTTRILRLGSPLFPVSGEFLTRGVVSVTSLPTSPGIGGGSDALRVMSLLNRASQVASSVDPIDRSRARIQQLGEHPLTGEFTVTEILGSLLPSGNAQGSGQSASAMPWGPNTEMVTPKVHKRRTLNNFFGLASPSASSPGKMSNSAIQASGMSPTAAIFFVGGPTSSPMSGPSSRGGKTTRSPEGGRAFDALINYLPSPSSIPEKVLLKQSILITTLSAPYLSASATSIFQSPQSGAFSTLSSPQKARDKKHTSMLGIPLSRRFTSDASGDETETEGKRGRRSTIRGRNKALPPAPSVLISDEHGICGSGWTVKRYCGPAHIIHVIPDSTVLFGAPVISSSSNPQASRSKRDTSGAISKPKLVTSIEQFVLAFAFPVSLSLCASSSVNPSPPVNGKGKGKSGLSPSKSTSMLPTPPSSSDFKARKHSGDQRSLMPEILVRESTHGPYASSKLEIGDLGGGRDPNNGGKPVPYLVRAGVMGGMFSVSYTTEREPGVQSLSLADLILFGALDGSIIEHGGGKAWLGGVGAKEVVDRLNGKARGTGPVEVRNSGAKVVLESVWIGGEPDSPHQLRASAKKGRDAPLPQPPAEAIEASRNSAEGEPRRSSSTKRNPAPTIPASESLIAAWETVSPVHVSHGRQPDHETLKEKDAKRRGDRDREQDRERAAERNKDYERSTRSRERSRSASHRPPAESRVEGVAVYDHRANAKRNSEERKRDDRRDRERRHERQGHEHERNHDRHGRGKMGGKRDTGLLTPPGSGSEVDVDVELETGLDSPVEDSKGMGIALIGRRQSKRREMEKPAAQDDRQSSRRPDVIRGHTEPAPVTREQNYASGSHRPELAHGQSVNDAQIPPSGSTESARKAINESFDIVPYYEYDRAKCDLEKESRRKERDRERESRRERDAEKERERESRRERHAERKREREKDKDREKHRVRDGASRDREREREREHYREVDYNRGGMGVPPSRSTQPHREDRERRSTSTRPRDYDDPDAVYQRRKRKSSSRQQTEESKEVYFYTYGELAQSKSLKDDRYELDERERDPPREQRRRDGRERRKDTRSSPRNYHYSKASDADHGNPPSIYRATYDAPGSPTVEVRRRSQSSG